MFQLISSLKNFLDARLHDMLDINELSLETCEILFGTDVLV